MIDVSDGLAADARHLGESGGVSLQIELERLPLAEGVADWEQGATAGEDYELCFTVAARRPRATWSAVLREADGAQVTLDRLGRARRRSAEGSARRAYRCETSKARRSRCAGSSTAGSARGSGLLAATGGASGAAPTRSRRANRGRRMRADRGW